MSRLRFCMRRLLIIALIAIVGCVTVRVIVGEDNKTEKMEERVGIDNDVIQNADIPIDSL